MHNVHVVHVIPHNVPEILSAGSGTNSEIGGIRSLHAVAITQDTTLPIYRTIVHTARCHVVNAV